MYLSGMSCKDISDETGIPLSTVRRRMVLKGIIRNQSQAVILAISKGKGAALLKGRSRGPMSEEQKIKISESKLKNSKARGWRINTNGYKEFTVGEDIGRHVHVILMEEKIGRKLHGDECVHHIDHNKLNNDIDNLLLMKKSDHNALHAKLNLKNRTRNSKGQFV